MNENNNQYTQYNNPQYVHPRIQTKSKFLTFIFSLIPGAGQMYQGLVKKGISIMVLFFGVIALSIMLYMPIICFALPIIWFYAFFEAINRINYSKDELNAIDDDFIINLKLEENEKVKNLFKGRHILFGWIIVAIGVYSLLNILVFNNWDLMSLLDDRVRAAMRAVVRLLPKLILPLICLLIGIKLIKSSIIKGEKATEKNMDQGEF